MQNYIAQGNVLDYTNDTMALIPSGSVVVVGAIAGIAVTDIAIGATGAVNTNGAYNLPVDGLTAAQGQRVYWDTDANLVVAESSVTTTFLGTMYRACSGGDSSATVVLIGTAEPGQAVLIESVSVADASDLASTELLVNTLKATVNSLLTALKNAELMARA